MHGHMARRVADQWAPSRSSLNPVIKNMINGLLQSDYMLVALDYEGLGEPGVNELRPYCQMGSWQCLRVEYG
ncbi:hypothetical protein ACINWCA157_0673 [Acinetobacter radioresistens WC-A-157]|nr:hypothetical protein ACINWCA157_0673 [Acinetobacter radioresistens WC-A-157]